MDWQDIQEEDPSQEEVPKNSKEEKVDPPSEEETQSEGVDSEEEIPEGQESNYGV